MPTSQINPKINFSEEEKVVFLVNVKNTQHAFIVVEDERQRMERYDFRTIATAERAIGDAIIASSNKSFSQIPRAFFASQEAKAGLEGHVSMNSASREDFISLAERSELQYQHWICSHEQYHALHQCVSNDMRDPPRYGLSGSEALAGPGYHNCYTWSVEKLNQAGLEAQLHWTAYVIVAKPSMVDKPSACALL
ncbi:MAG: hypothetical protein K0S27_737 [Gammaproteobacteria bacterium]|jgi:hypothetical protein|nr:hypothetical protein [Gammaproteobacteria bacterium]